MPLASYTSITHAILDREREPSNRSLYRIVILYEKTQKHNRESLSIRIPMTTWTT